VLQLAAQAAAALWERLHVTETPPQSWLAKHVPAGAAIGYDPMLMAEDGLARFSEAGLTMRPVEANPIDAVWPDRPAPPLAPAEPYALVYAGRSSDEKRADIAAALRSARHDAAVISDPASIAWLLNIRGGDVPFTPFALGFALIHADGRAELFMEPAKLPPATRAWLGNAVTVAPRAALAGALDAMAGKTVRVDAGGSPVWFAQRLRAAGATVGAGSDPCLLPKARKNVTEQQGARDAHARDAVALCRFLHLLATEGASGRLTEMSAADALLDFRSQVRLFRGESFPAISGAGENGAIIHYRVSAATNRRLNANEVYLIDCGAQYLDGTTDVTRTIWTGPDAPPAALRAQVTRVMQGHIAIATLVFPHGVAGPHLDGFARRALWQAGLDYDHGTGHGVGAYLSVHEGPVGLSRAARMVPIEAGMILSNEPGFYLPGEYGIRLENLLLVQEAALPDAKKPFLRFETLTLAPFDRALLDASLLSAEERAWLDAYHARVLAAVGPGLEPDVRGWLAEACAPMVG
jgi:Xaa-Pro aminopeptidase